MERGYTTIGGSIHSLAIHKVVRTHVFQNMEWVCLTGWYQQSIHTGRPIKPDECSTSGKMYDPSNRASSAAYQYTQGSIQDKNVLEVI